jgi:hypothetical protein
VIPLYRHARKLFKKSGLTLAGLKANTTELFSSRDLVIIIFFTILGIGGVFAATLITVTAPDSQGAGYVAATSCDEAVTINSPSNFSSTSKTFVVDTITVSGVDNNNCAFKVMELTTIVSGSAVVATWNINSCANTDYFFSPGTASISQTSVLCLDAAVASSISGASWNSYTGSQYAFSALAPKAVTSISSLALTFYNPVTAPTPKYTATLNGWSTPTLATPNRNTSFVSVAPNTSSYAQISSFTENFSGGITIDAYLDFGSSADNWERIIDFGNGTPMDNIIFARSGITSNLILEIDNGAPYAPPYKSQCQSNGAITSGFARYTVTVDANRVCKLYKNGTPLTIDTCLGSSSSPCTLNQLPVTVTRTLNYIARSNWFLYDPAFEGSFRAIRIYTKALTQDEITATPF